MNSYNIWTIESHSDTNTSSNVTLDGWETNSVAQSASVTYSGATTNELVVNPVSYLIVDEEYCRCQITATPVTPSTLTPTLTSVTNNIYVGITKDKVYLSTVNCAPPGTLTDGNTITYPNTAPNPQTPMQQLLVFVLNLHQMMFLMILQPVLQLLMIRRRNSRSS